MIVQIDKKLSEITIENYKKMEEVLEESQGCMPMTDIADLNSIDMHDFGSAVHEPKPDDTDDNKK